MALKPVSVSQLNEYIGRIISADPLLGMISVKGEVSNLKYHSTGHVYFSISDSASKINCFFPRDYAAKLHYQLGDGMEVILTGSVNVFKKNGTYSIYVRNVELDGAGSLALAFEKLKEKLSAEGLFDKSHKKSISEFPSKIGVITSDTGAAVKDILKILSTRNNLVDITVFPVLVQGDAAAADIAHMIDYINVNFPNIDTLIIGRGGGSQDDLWAFNEEIVARSIYNSKIPVISAVGHEIDFTISDLVADLRAETPTAAAQIAVPDINQLREKMSELKENLNVQLSNKLMYNRLLIDNTSESMSSALSSLISCLKSQMNRYRLILEENNPQKILKGGYAVVSGDNGRIITGIDQISVDNHYKITFKDGYAMCTVNWTGSEDHE